jgi:hypothetical protein
MSVSTAEEGGLSQRAKEKSRVVEQDGMGISGSPGSVGSWSDSPFVRRRSSLMGKALERTECIVVEVGSPDAPRLVCYLPTFDPSVREWRGEKERDGS